MYVIISFVVYKRVIISFVDIRESSVLTNTVTTEYSELLSYLLLWSYWHNQEGYKFMFPGVVNVFKLKLDSCELNWWSILMTATIYKCSRFYMCTHSPLPN